ADELAFVRLLSLFPKVGEKTCFKLWDKLGRQLNLKNPDQVAWMQKNLPAAAGLVWKKLEPILVAYEKENLRNDPGEIIFQLVKCFYKEYAVETFENFKRRLEDIDELVNFSSRFTTVDDFLNEIILLTNMDGDAGEVEEGGEQDVLRLSTVHQAKGLEWKAVFLLWLTDGMFPSMRSLSEGADNEAEERRLFYVAATRAKDELFLCVPEMRRTHDGGVLSCTPSRFIQELNADLLKEEFVGFV
ncbi:MAG: ATP-dependent helicase, partial [Lentisphaerota bacterium]